LTAGPVRAVRAYVVVVIAAGAAVRVAPAALSIAANVAVLAVLLNEALLRGRLQEELSGRVASPNVRGEAAAALTLVPVVSLAARSAPIPGPGLLPIAVVGATALAATLLLNRPASPRSVTSVLGPDGTQLAIAAGGLPLGLIAHLALDLPALDPSDNPVVVALSVAVLIVFVGFVGEIVFRAVIQTVLAQALGSRGIAATAAVAAGFGASLGSLQYAAVLAVSAVLFGWCLHRTGSILGTSIASGFMHVGLFLLWPALR
jgi:membrane protease YdiL (CAAX protease family)